MNPSNPSQASISTLATEIIEIIAGKFLEPHDIYSLRVTCRALNNQTSFAFSKTFKTLTTDLSLTSLQKLEEISKHELIKHQVQLLVIQGPAKSTFGKGLTWNRHALGHIIQPFPSNFTLENVLNALLNCRSFRIISEGQDQSGFCESDCLLPCDVITLLFHIFATTNINPKAIYLDSILSGPSRYRQINRLRQFPIRVKEHEKHAQSLYWTPTFLSKLAKLEEFSITYNVSAKTGHWTRNILIHATGLRRLYLRPGYIFSTEFMRSFTIASPIYSCLHDLGLSSMHTSSESLLKLLSCCKNGLRSLELWFVIISGQRGTWKETFTEMSSSLPVLESLKIAHLKGAREELEESVIVFPQLEEDEVIPGIEGELLNLVYMKSKDENCVVGVNYQGSFANRVLERLADTAQYFDDVFFPILDNNG